MSGLWPGRTRCVVMLTFDMDGASGMLRRETSVAKRPSVMSQGDFGPEVGAPRIIDLLSEHKAPATFFVPGWVAERHPDAVRAALLAGHEVAHHGYMHEAPATLSGPKEEAGLLDRGSAALEKVTGQRPLGYRSPSWDVSEWTLGLLAERGFAYDSSLMGHDVPYFVDVQSGRPSHFAPIGIGVSATPRPSPRGRGVKQTERSPGKEMALSPGKKGTRRQSAGTGGGARQLVELPVHWSLDDTAYYPFNPAIGRMGPLLSPQVALDTWLWEFDMAYEHGGAFMLTMHPYVSGHWSRLNGLRRLIKHIKAHRGVKFMRCIDVATGWTETGLRRRAALRPHPSASLGAGPDPLPPKRLMHFGVTCSMSS